MIVRKERNITNASTKMKWIKIINTIVIFRRVFYQFFSGQIDPFVPNAKQILFYWFHWSPLGFSALTDCKFVDKNSLKLCFC